MRRTFRVLFSTDSRKSLSATLTWEGATSLAMVEKWTNELNLDHGYQAVVVDGWSEFEVSPGPLTFDDQLNRLVKSMCPWA